MGRAIVRQPQAFLMDEPLSNLDAKLRVQMRADIKKIQSELGVTTIYVTHDQVEAMTMGHRVAVMRKGELQQVAPPQELYDGPVNVFVGGFIGSPAMNMVEARIERGTTGSRSVARRRRARAGRRDARAQPGARGVRGRDDRPRHPARRASRTPRSPTATAGRGCAARSSMREALGSEVLVHFTVAARAGGHRGRAGARRGRRRRPGARQLAAGDPPKQRLLVGRFSPRTHVAEGDVVEVSVDQRSLHFFDLESGLAISRTAEQAHH